MSKSKQKISTLSSAQAFLAYVEATERSRKRINERYHAVFQELAGKEEKDGKS